MPHLSILFHPFFWQWWGKCFHIGNFSFPNCNLFLLPLIILLCHWAHCWPVTSFLFTRTPGSFSSKPLCSQQVLASPDVWWYSISHVGSLCVSLNCMRLLSAHFPQCFQIPLNSCSALQCISHCPRCVIHEVAEGTLCPSFWVISKNKQYWSQYWSHY